MQGHFVVMSLFSLFVSTTFAVLMRDDVREQVRLGAALFGGFVGSALVLGWILYVLPL